LKKPETKGKGGYKKRPLAVIFQKGGQPESGGWPHFNRCRPKKRTGEKLKQKEFGKKGRPLFCIVKEEKMQFWEENFYRPHWQATAANRQGGTKGFHQKKKGVLWRP